MKRERLLIITRHTETLRRIGADVKRHERNPGILEDLMEESMVRMAVFARFAMAEDEVVVADHDPTMTHEWAKARGIHLNLTQPGQPQLNAYIERYNRTVRYDWLAQTLFDSIEQVQAAATR